MGVPQNEVKRVTMSNIVYKHPCLWRDYNLQPQC
jgi:hypothetical protein